mmetsp:Transcript_16003/g.37734  ORF Transcript_16003/g.37734 Transcript_16003/m.37734 type:complete len:760 (-) Transcript_16003:18-2297(-)
MAQCQGVSPSPMAAAQPAASGAAACASCTHTALLLQQVKEMMLSHQLSVEHVVTDLSMRISQLTGSVGEGSQHLASMNTSVVGYSSKQSGSFTHLSAKSGHGEDLRVAGGGTGRRSRMYSTFKHGTSAAASASSLDSSPPVCNPMKSDVSAPGFRNSLHPDSITPSWTHQTNQTNSMSVSNLLQGVMKTLTTYENNDPSHKWRNQHVRTYSAKRRSSLDDVQRVAKLEVSWGPILRWYWDTFCLFVIIADAALIGAVADRIAVDDSYLIATSAFTGWYVFEMFLRGLLERRKFLIGKDRYWNVLDGFVTTTAVVDTCRLWISDDRSQSTLVLRLFRLLRVLRFLRRISDLRKLLLSMVSSALTLFWSLVLLLLLIFIFAVFFTQATVRHINDHDHQSEDHLDHALLDDYFGSLSRSMISLYMAITNGKAWGEFSDLLARTHPLSEVIFIIYLCLAVMGIMNVVTAVFVESAMRASKSYKDLMLQEKHIRDRINVKHMKQIFQSIDTDQNGVITMDELVSFLSDESLGLQMYFQALELSARDTTTLFHLLDTDGSGEVDIEEFCDGCMRLGGPATSFDLNSLMYEQRRTNKQTLLFIKHVSTQLQFVRRKLDGERTLAHVVADDVRSAGPSHRSERFRPSLASLGSQRSRGSLASPTPSVVGGPASPTSAESVHATAASSPSVRWVTQEAPAMRPTQPAFFNMGGASSPQRLNRVPSADGIMDFEPTFSDASNPSLGSHSLTTASYKVEPQLKPRSVAYL